MRGQTVLIVDDEKLVRWSLKQKLQAAEYQTLEAATAQEAMALFEEHLPDLVTLDVRLPDSNGLSVLLQMKKIVPAVPVIMITAHGVVDDAVRSLQSGAYDYMEKPIDFTRLLHSVSRALEARDLRLQLESAKREIDRVYSIDKIIGQSEAMLEVKELVHRVAASHARTILIQGESGTGKDLVAKALHYHSSRASKPFMVLNCAAIPEHLLESELFGHERGAFTDAKSLKKGLFELANGGTLFFDEIGELDQNLQSKLLRVLEDQVFRRIGGVKDIHTDVRIICASNRDIEEMVTAKKFREDLFYRLSVIPIDLPPLRSRGSDVDLLIDHFVEDYNSRFRKSVTGIGAAARQQLREYQWPGNVRELKNAIERALILQDDGLIEPDVLPARIVSGKGRKVTAPATLSVPPEGIDLYGVERELIRRALVRAGGNQSLAARLLSVSRDTLRYKMKKYRLPKKLDALTEDSRTQTTG